jgi:hypothetical protein
MFVAIPSWSALVLAVFQVHLPPLFQIVPIDVIFAAECTVYSLKKAVNVFSSKINKLNSLFIQPICKMKKVFYTGVVLFIGMMALVSCKRNYHCHCSYNNKVVYSKDMGAQYESKAQEECSTYDTTIIGEVWNCSIY